jgi:hypothetical protein
MDMHKLTFFPLGNADTCLIELENSGILLFDYANVANSDDGEDKRIDLEEALRKKLEEIDRDCFDVVAFTHLDDDHIHGASEFFHLSHAKKYQGEGRVEIKTLYVPAAAIIEEGCENEARIIQAEARYRLREGEGIRVFSRPGQLEDWLDKQGLSLENRDHLITDAGQVIPKFSLERDGVEIFVHSPFASRLKDGSLIDRNTDALAVQVTFSKGGKQTKLFLSSDLTHEAFSDIVNITKYHGNEDRLEWDIFNTSHHCSYLSLSSEKGEHKTTPVPEVKWLLEEQARDRALIVSTSKPIPADDSDDQPPHRQAANYYKEVVASVDGEFLVTMEHPNKSGPEPLVIEIGSLGATVKKAIESATIRAVSSSAPRAG